jgi:chitin disaccharide deacetylase
VRRLIINADGYGFTDGVTRAIEECVAFGTVRSISANVNFPASSALADFVKTYPGLSVGCHVNPVVGPPVLPPHRVPTLLDEKQEFLYQRFSGRFLTGRIRGEELKAEMLAQVHRTRDLVGDAFSHIDFHMGLHRLPGLYRLFLDVVEASGIGRIRTHRYQVGMESRFPRARHVWHLVSHPTRIPKFAWNLWLRKRALARGFSMPDRRVEITTMTTATIRLEAYLTMLQNIPVGTSEFVAHPGYIDDDLRRWSSYLDQRERERAVLLSPIFRDSLFSSGIELAGYRDILRRDAR